MLKRILFAVAPLMLMAGTVFADDDLLSTIAKMDGDTTAAAHMEETDQLGQADVDALLGDGEESDEEAIAACFRRVGYRWGYRGFYRSYSCYRPYYRSYSYNCYPTYYHAPVSYSCYTPIYRSYWGCW